MVTAVDFETLSLAEIIRLKDELSQVLKRRFERNLCLGFTDVVGSTAYFSRFGDEAGRGLQQRHFDALNAVLTQNGGRIVDTAGDGAFTCWQSVEGALLAMITMQDVITQQNQSRPREHQLSVRIGIHWGAVLTDGVVVTGDAVNLAARVASSGTPGEMRLTRQAFQELSNTSRIRCRGLPPIELKGITKPVDLVVYEWRDRMLFPSHVRVEETGEDITLPQQDTISFGRLREKDGVPANDIVLSLPDKQMTQQISRWHFELRRRNDGFMLRPVSDQATEVDGQVIQKGADVAIRPGVVVRLSRVMTLTFMADPLFGGASGADDTLLKETLAPR